MAAAQEVTQDYDQSFTIDDSSSNIPEVPKTSPPESPTFQRVKYQEILQKQEREKEAREQLQREKERLEREKREKEQQQQQLELERIKNAEREQKERERVEKELAESRKKTPFRVSEQPGVDLIATEVKTRVDEPVLEQPLSSQLRQALAAATAITALGSEPIQTGHYQTNEIKPEKLKEIYSEPELDRTKQKPVEIASFEQPHLSKITAISQQQQGQLPEQASTILISSVYPQKEVSSEATITVIGSEPIKSTTASVQYVTPLKDEPQPISITVEKKKPTLQQYPTLINETTTETTTITKSISQIHELREEVVEQRDPTTGEVNKQILESELISHSVHEPDVRPHKMSDLRGELSEDSTSELSAEQELLERQQFAGKYLGFYFYFSLNFFYFLSVSHKCRLFFFY